LKVSIITAVYNRASTIADTLESVRGQDYPGIEHIVIDGMSTDGTDEVISRYRSGLARVVREKDSGIYEALNKGIGLASGDIVGFLHADDVYADRGVITSVVEGVRGLGAGAIGGVYGDLEYVQWSDMHKRVRYWRSGEYRVERFRRGWMPAHPTVYLRRECYEKFGGFREDFQIAADYELMVRMLAVGGVAMGYIPRVLVKMRVGGKSNATLRNRLQANREDQRAWEVNGVGVPIGLRWMKPMRKLLQYVLR
jgi:glycosyltransferase